MEWRNQMEIGMRALVEDGGGHDGFVESRILQIECLKGEKNSVLEIE
jgi:hypothetical protein